FAFLLYGGDGGGDDRAAEYGRWATDLRENAGSVNCERLADQAWIAGAPRPDSAFVRGFFVVRAPDFAAAVELARRHPHAQVGSIEVRPIDTP
ncbi:MAG: YciI family protein, partial [Acidimicrobiia bacterium]